MTGLSLLQPTAVQMASPLRCCAKQQWLVDLERIKAGARMILRMPMMTTGVASSWGCAFDANGSLYASEGNSGRIRIIGRKKSSISLNTDGYKDSYTGDLVFDRTRSRLYVADQANFRVAVIDLASRKVRTSIRAGRLPFAMAMSPDGTRLYVTNIGMFEYKAIDGPPVPFPLFGFPSRRRGQRSAIPTCASPTRLP